MYVNPVLSLLKVGAANFFRVYCIIKFICTIYMYLSQFVY